MKITIKKTTKVATTLFVVCALIFSSCKKSYTCYCTSHSTSVTSTSTVKASKESEAETSCSSSGGASSNCSLEEATSKATGNAIFYYSSAGTNATVTITDNGQSGTISTYSTTTPSCGASGCANFTLPVGTYSYSASSTFNNWSGTVTVTANGCTAELLN